MSRAGTNLRTSYLESNEVLHRPYQKVLIVAVFAIAVLLPAATSTYFVHLLDLCFLSAIGALGLMLLSSFYGLWFGYTLYRRSKLAQTTLRRCWYVINTGACLGVLKQVSPFPHGSLSGYCPRIACPLGDVEIRSEPFD